MADQNATLHHQREQERAEAKYTRLKRIGKGAFGVVYLIENKATKYNLFYYIFLISPLLLLDRGY